MSAFSYHSEKYDFSSAKKATFLQNTDDLDKYCKSAKKKKRYMFLRAETLSVVNQVPHLICHGVIMSGIFQIAVTHWRF